MHQPAMLPQNFDQIFQNTAVLEFGSRTSPSNLKLFPESKSGLTQNTPPPLPKMKNSNFLPWVQIWAYPEHPSPIPPPENEKL